MSDRDKLMTKLRKLLALGKDERANPHEAAAALRQAGRMMAEHDIAEAEVSLAQLDAGAMEFGETSVRPDGLRPSDGGRPMRECPGWAGVLAIGVAAFTETVVTRRARYPEGQTLVFQGERNDVILAQWLFGALVAQINGAVRASGFTGRGEAGQFRHAAAGELQRRMEEAAKDRQRERAAAAQSGSRALVVVDRKRTEIVARFGRQQTRTRTHRYSASSYGARQAGRQAGAGMAIPSGRPIGAGQATRRLTQ